MGTSLASLYRIRILMANYNLIIYKGRLGHTEAAYDEFLVLEGTLKASIIVTEKPLILYVCCTASDSKV